MKCTNCGNDLPDGSKFCFICGAKQLIELPAEQPEKNAPIEETGEKNEATPTESDSYGSGADKRGDDKFCPYCGAKNDVESRFCCSCGKNMTIGQPEIKYEDNTPKPRKKFPLKGLVVGIIAVGIVVAMVMNYINGETSEKNTYVAYMKDGNVKQVNLENYKKNSIEYEGIYSSVETEQFGYGFDDVKYSEDGSYVFYPTNYNNGTFQLNVQKNGGRGISIKIDSGVGKYTVLKNNKVIYYKNYTLYISDIKGNKEEIASLVAGFNYYIDKDEENIVWLGDQSDDDDKVSVYQRDIALKKDKKLLAQNLDSVISVDIGDNLTQIAALEGDELYIISDFKEKEKIDSGVDSIILSNILYKKDTEAVYYTKKWKKVITATDIVEDDCADMDEKIETIDEEAYEKYERDLIRENLYDYKLNWTIRELYCYKNGKITKVDNAYDYGSARIDSETLIYNRYNLQNIPIIKMSEIPCISDIEYLFSEKLDRSMETCLYKGDEVVVLDETMESKSCIIDEENQIGYGTKWLGNEDPDEDAKYSCYSFSIAEDSDGKCEMVVENTSHFVKVKNGKIYSYFSYGDELKMCDLYCNDKILDSNVIMDSVSFLDEYILYIVAYDSSNSNEVGTLKMYDGEEAKIIAEDVFEYKEFDEGTIVALTDYDTGNSKGNLKCYREKDGLVDLDQDVTFLFNGTASMWTNENGIKFWY